MEDAGPRPQVIPGQTHRELMEKQRGRGAAETFAAELSKLPVNRLRGQNPQLLCKNQRLKDRVSPGSIFADSIRDNVVELVR